MKNLGKAISNYRRMCGLTQDQLAVEAGVSTIDVAEWEKGDTLPDIESVCMLADCFEISVDELLGRTQAEKIDLEFDTQKEADRFNLAVQLLECCAIARQEGLLAVDELMKKKEGSTYSFLKFAVAYFMDGMQRKIPLAECKEFMKNFAENENDSWTAKMVCEGVALIFSGENEEILCEVLKSFLGRKYCSLISTEDQMKRWKLSREAAIRFYSEAEGGKDTGILNELLETEDYRICRMLRHSENDIIMKAFWGASKEVRVRMFNNLSDRMILLIGEELLDYFADAEEVTDAQEKLLANCTPDE